MQGMWHKLGQNLYASHTKEQHHLYQLPQKMDATYRHKSVDLLISLLDRKQIKGYIYIQ